MKERVCAILEEELKNSKDLIEKIDLEKGYDIMGDDECFILALNRMYSHERKRLYAQLQTQKETSHGFSTYLKKIYNDVDELKIDS